MTEFNSFDTSWILICAFLVMTMQIGFCMLEAGLVRQKNSINVAFKNLMDFIVAGLAYWAIGFGVMYGVGEVNGIYGTTMFLKSHADGAIAFFLFQMVFCSAAATIVGGALAERTRLSAYLVISALVAAVFYPLVGHWVWGGALGEGTPGWLAQRGFIDFAGATVVHGTGGWLALAAVIIVGPRIGRFDKSKSPLRGSNYPVATVGVLVLWFGWFGFNGGSTLAFNDQVPLIIVNTSLAAAAGGFTLLSWAWLKERKPDIAASLNGTIAGLVGVTAGANIYEATDAILVGIVCAVVCGIATRLLEKLKIDDVIGAWPAHAVAGGAGTLMVAVFGDISAFTEATTRADQLLIQASGVVTVAVWAFGVGYAVLFVVNKMMPLRVTEADERIGLNIAEHNASTDLVELVGEMQLHRNNGDFKTSVYEEPHTEVGLIAAEYNRVLSRVSLEMETREEAYRQLEEESEFRFIFENSHEGIVQFARNGAITKANPAAVSLLGFDTADELIAGVGQWMAKLQGGNKESKLRALVRQLNETGIAREVELSFIRANDGLEAHVQIDLRRLVTADGTEPTVLASVIDVSAKKANDSLRLERDIANAASHAKSEFLANMSHEIRTPLNGVTGMLELLSRTELDRRQERFIHVAGTSADTLLSVINDILDVSKIEAGKLELEKTEFNLPQLLSDVLDMFAQQAASKGLELASLLPTNIPDRVIGDPERLRQVFVNLVGNALKFTERGSVTLRVRSESIVNSKAHFRFSVEDTGVGINPAEKERLFEAFTQADTSTTRKHGGTGLGLNITRQLIDLMGGNISVESQLGSGSTFYVELDLAVGAQVAAEQSTKPNNSDIELNKSIRVLAVDDHPINLEILDGMLEPEGYQITAVEGAPEALALLAKAADDGKPFSIALLDYQMPSMDGKELVKRIRSDERFDDLRLIMLTSIDQAISVVDREKLNIHASITKPLRRSRLFDAINETLGRPVGQASPVLATPVSDLAAESIAAARSYTPAQVAQAASGESNAMGSYKKPIVTTTGKRLNILVVEDNPVNQMVIDELLHELGHTTVLAENGEQALARVDEEDIDLVLMDCQMPIMDGFEATRRLRQLEKDEKLPRTPIIAVTSNAIKGDRERCLEAGMDDYVSKPINTVKLAESISRYAGSD